MARGRQDYTWGVLQDVIMPGRYTSNFHDIQAGLCNSMEWTVRYTYTVPAGKRLYLAGIHISSMIPEYCSAYLRVDEANILAVYFLSNYAFDLGSYGSYPIEAGEVFDVRIFNYTSLNMGVIVNVWGLLEDIV